MSGLEKRDLIEKIFWFAIWTMLAAAVIVGGWFAGVASAHHTRVTHEFQIE
jgi:hypothetical protein